MGAQAAKAAMLPEAGVYLTNGTLLVFVLGPDVGGFGVEVEDAITDEVFVIRGDSITDWKRVG